MFEIVLKSHEFEAEWVYLKNLYLALQWGCENLFLFWLLWVCTPGVSFWLFGLNEFQNETHPIVKFSPLF